MTAREITKNTQIYISDENGGLPQSSEALFCKRMDLLMNQDVAKY